MRWSTPLMALLYTAMAAFASPAPAAELNDLRQGDMRKLVLSEGGEAVEGVFTRPDGTEVSLADLRGKVLVVNFWATWCAPCRAEMPSLNALDAALESDRFDVVAIASGRNPLPKVQAFNDETGIDRLEIFLDPRSNILRSVGAFGLPTTLILGADGREIGRLQGDADWASDEALTLIQATLEQN